jgi:hypothetical protein
LFCYAFLLQLELTREKMKSSSKLYGLTLAVTSLAALPLHALAQATTGILIAYTPGGAATSSVPTLSEWGMLGLSLLLAAIAVYGLRNKTGGKPLAAIILTSALAMGGYSGQKVIGEANAAVTNADCPVSVYQCYMQAAGGTINAQDGGIIVNDALQDNVITNNSGRTQTVTSVAPVDPLWDEIRTPVGTPQCVAGLVVPSGTNCYVVVNNRR